MPSFTKQLNKHKVSYLDKKYLNTYVIYHTYNISTKEQVAIENNDLDTQNSNHAQELNLHIDGAF